MRDMSTIEAMMCFAYVANIPMFWVLGFYLNGEREWEEEPTVAAVGLVLLLSPLTIWFTLPFGLTCLARWVFRWSCEAIASVIETERSKKLREQESIIAEASAIAYGRSIETFSEEAGR